MQKELIDRFYDHLYSGNSFRNITEARKIAEQEWSETITPGTAKAKLVEECLEVAIQRHARVLSEAVSDEVTVFRRLQALLDRQPNLGTRTATSIEMQAYSTPPPIGYLAGVMADIQAKDIIYEPTAGHGSLTLAANKQQCILNEFDPQRAQRLRLLGYPVVTEHDALDYAPNGKFDVILANPPFGSLLDGEGKKRLHQMSYGSDTFRTQQIDHFIALRSLRVLKDDGRAVLILGGEYLNDEVSRSNSYNSKSNRAFYWSLYRYFNVTDHFTVSGDLYKKQGAGFPIDMIRIERRRSHENIRDRDSWPRQLPSVDVPRVYKSFDALEGYLEQLLSHRQLQQESGNQRDTPILSKSPGLDTTRRNTEAPISSRSPGELVHHPEAIGLSASPGDPLPTDVPQSPGRRDGGGVKPNPQTNSPEPGADAILPATVPGRFGAVGDDVGGNADREQSADANLAGSEQSNISPRTETFRNGDRRIPADDRGHRDAQTVAQPVESATGTDVVQESQSEEEKLQLPYTPVSQGQTVDTYTPRNLQTATRDALRAVVAKHGDLDSFVARELEYKDTATLHNFLSAEQIDAVALAINNLKEGTALILGDQTGIGKGRVMAAMMRYATLNNQTPIFTTKDTKLYGDIMRDLADIGMTNVRPLMTNNSTRLPLPDGGSLQSSSKAQHDAELRRVMQQIEATGGMSDYDVIFTTYTQMQTVKGETTLRREFLSEAAKGALLLFDESHEAGGGETMTRGKAPNRADFARSLQHSTAGVIYSSATFAKNPAVMSLYLRTSMSDAVEGGAYKLQSLLERGGVPLQQALSEQLAKSGQYIRRERSFDGIGFTPEIAPVDKQIAENLALIMREILLFDELKDKSLKDLKEDLKSEAKAIATDDAVGKAAVKSTNFTAIMHNVISQMLLSLKADASVEACVNAIKRGEKPVVALSNTMGAFIQKYAEDRDISPGSQIDADFGDVLAKYLDRTRHVMIGDPYGKKTLRWLTDEELGFKAVAKYEQIHTLIRELDFSRIPLSPIDHITSRLQAQGLRVVEVTGRTTKVDYQADGTVLYKKRSGSETSEAAKINAVAAFNGGDADVIILNRSGSTGISLHASAKFQDQRPRHMIVAQAELDINLVMQMFGRIHRTGQVELPRYSLFLADIPAERRPGAVLMKKLASLNANTTAARKGGFSLESVPDILNSYGNVVIRDMLEADSELHKALGYPLGGGSSDQELSPAGAVAKVTGRIALLPLAQQEEVWQQIIRDYQEHVQRMESLGRLELEATNLPLDAKPVARYQVLEPLDNSGSPFTDGIYLDVVDAKQLVKPLTTLDVVSHLSVEHGLQPVRKLPEDFNFANLIELSESLVGPIKKELQQRIDIFRVIASERLEDKALARTLSKLEESQIKLNTVLDTYPVGQTVWARMGIEKIPAVVTRVWARSTNKKSINPTLLSNWRISIIGAGMASEVAIPLSQVAGVGGSEVSLEVEPTPEVVYSSFDKFRQSGREERQILRGNLLRAADQFANAKVVTYTTHNGRRNTGLLIGSDTDVVDELSQKPFALKSADQLIKLLKGSDYKGIIGTSDEILRVSHIKGKGYSSGVTH